MAIASSTPEDPRLARTWLTANVWCALLLVAANLATEVVGYRGLPFGLYAVALQVVAAACSAVLIGQVLQGVLPIFPMRAWVALHAVMAALGGLGEGMLSEKPVGEPTLSGAIDELLFVLAGGFLMGAALGALVGALQAIVLRRYARGLKRWIGMSALGVGLAAIIVFFAAGAFRWRSDVASSLMAAGVGMVSLMIIAFVMLPAVRRLRPIDDAGLVADPAAG